MSTTPRWSLPYPTLSDIADVPADLGALALALDSVAMDLTQGVVSSRPAAADAGRYYYATDEGILYRDDGSAWHAVGHALGSTANTAAAGNDSRLSDSRTPTGAAGGDLTGSTYPNPSIAAGAVTDTKVAAANKDGAAGTASMRTLGTGASQAAAGNDSRLSDSRVPTGAAGGDLTGSTYPNPSVAAGAITDTKVAAANKDGASGTASMRTLGTGSAQAAAGNDARFPTTQQKNALAGTVGTPDTANRYVTETDTDIARLATAQTFTALKTFGAGVRHDEQQFTTSGTIVDTVGDDVLYTGAGGHTLTLPTVGSTNRGRRFFIKNQGTTGTSISVALGGSDTANGSSGVTTLRSRDTLIAIAPESGSNWTIMYAPSIGDIGRLLVDNQWSGTNDFNGATNFEGSANMYGATNVHGITTVDIAPRNGVLTLSGAGSISELTSGRIVVCTGTTYTVNLPTAIEGEEFEILNLATGIITLAAQGGNDIEGAGSTSLRSGARITIVAVDNTQWVVQAHNTGLRQIVTFTAGGNFTKATYPWLQSIRVRGVAGGGGGGAANTAETMGGGGGGGGYGEMVLYTANLVTTEVVTVGTGGGGGSGSGGSAGTNTSFGSHFTVNGGGGGSLNGGGGAGGSGDGLADVQIKAQSGGNGGANTNQPPGDGGNSQLGFGSKCGARGTNAAAAASYGGGGGGGHEAAGTARTGGAGSDGIVVVELYG